MNTLYLILAQVAAGGAPAGGAPAGGGAAGPAGACGQGGIQPILLMGLMFAAMYFLLIRPQQKRAKEQAAMIQALGKGDTVITRGGIIGKITGVTDNIVTLELQEKVRVRIMKQYIESKHVESSSAAKAAKDKDKDAKDAPAEAKN